MLWIDNYIHIKAWHVITPPCYNFNRDSAKPPLKLRNGCIITSHIKLWVWLLIHALISVKSLWPSDAVWRRHWTGSLLSQVMACCLVAPSHYLNQCWLIISGDQRHQFEGNFTRDRSVVNHYIISKITYLKFHSNLPGANVLISVNKRGPKIQWVKIPFRVIESICREVSSKRRVILIFSDLYKQELS